MKTSILLTAASLGAALAAPNAGTSIKTNCKQNGHCNADNCARAVTGTRLGRATLSAHLADCTSFFQCTAYPATSTVTKTATVYPVTQTATVFPQTSVELVTYTTIPTTVATITSVESIFQTSSVQVTETQTVLETITVNQNAKRGKGIVGVTRAASQRVVCPTHVPKYASACSGTARFSSACSCAGVSHSTKTMTTPVKTVTITATSPTTVTVSQTEIDTSSVVAFSSVTALTTVSTTIVDIVTISTTIEQTSITTVTSTPVFNAYCANGQGVNALSSSCTQAGCGLVNMRIEGATETVYEGLVYTGPMYVTTPSGGTHLCDGTNNGANPAPGANGIGAIAVGAQLCGYTYDGTFSQQFDDFFINKVGTSNSNDGSNRFWGILKDYQFTSAGGCESEYTPTEDLLWAFDAFNANYFLKVQPTRGTVTLTPGASRQFTIVDGQTGNPVSGASFGGSTSDSNGNVQYTAPTTPGTYRVKALKSGSIRSNAVIIQVVA